MNIIIRKENSADYADIYELTRNAFEHAPCSDGDEHELLQKLRDGTSYIPELALVAEIAGKIVGHIMFTTVEISDVVVVIVGPVSVLNEMQCKGIGGRLIHEGHRIAKAMGYGFSILVGHETYYPRFGYRKASSYGITTHIDVPDENFMAYDLQGGQTHLIGEVKYPDAWGLN